MWVAGEALEMLAVVVVVVVLVVGLVPRAALAQVKGLPIRGRGWGMQASSVATHM